MKHLAVISIIFICMPNILIGQKEKNQTEYDYASIQLDKALKTKRLGQTFYVGGFIALGTGAIMVLTNKSPEAGGVIAGVGAVSWVVGAFVMGHAKTEIKYYENKKMELSINCKEFNHINNNVCELKYIPAVNIRIRF